MSKLCGFEEWKWLKLKLSLFWLINNIFLFLGFFKIIYLSTDLPQRFTWSCQTFYFYFIFSSKFNTKPTSLTLMLSSMELSLFFSKIINPKHVTFHSLSANMLIARPRVDCWCTLSCLIKTKKKKNHSWEHWRIKQLKKENTKIVILGIKNEKILPLLLVIWKVKNE